MNLFAAVRRWLARPVARFVEDILDGGADGHDEMRVATSPVRVNDIGDATLDLDEAQNCDAPVNYLDERIVLRDMALHSFTAYERKLMRELSRDLTRPRRNR